MAGSHGVYQKALGNVTVACFVKASHAEIYAEFGKIAAAEALRTVAELFIQFLLNNSASLPYYDP
jgi:hypothetical protein